MYKKRVYRRRGANALRKAGRVAGKARARTRPAKMANVEALAKSVNRIKTQMRREREVKEYTPPKADVDELAIAQVDGNSSGTDFDAINPALIQQGTGVSERVGNKVKLIGIALRFQLRQQAAMAGGGHIIFDIWKTHDMNYPISTLVDLLYDVDSISGVREGSSSRNQDWIKSKKNPSGLVQLVRSKRVYMPNDQFSGQSYFKNFKMFIKQNTDLQYNGSAAQDPTNVRYFIVARSTIGNRSSTTTCTLSGVPITSTGTAFFCQWRYTGYYVDA